MTARTLGKELRFQLLGQLAVRTEDREVELGSPKQRAVLAVLLLHANEVVPTDRIIDMVWDDHPPRTAEHSVQIYISELRRALSNGSAGDLIDTRPPGYVINVPPEAVDTLRFERLVRDGLSAIRSGDPARGRPKLAQALEIWRSDPLADFAYEDFAQGFIRSLIELHSDALEALAVLELDKGDFETAREVARSAIEADPLREEPRRVMMLALYHTGRQAEALRHYSAYRESLADELGIEPTETLRDLEERMLLQDPMLDLMGSRETEGNPYRGLRPFSEDDADVYFGRESLVAEVLERLRNGPGFVSIVGPSGSGKSSAAGAGVMPVLREQGETAIAFQPGSRPLWELAGALDRAGFGNRASLLRRFESDPNALVDAIKRPVTLIVDQFEEIFTIAEPDAAIRFSELLAAGIRDHRTALRVVATLRADYYDKPLSTPALAGVFTDSVVSVKPMTPAEIERAVVEPARAAGVVIEPALLAQLVADMGNEPGALPLLQFTLFELFERTENELTLTDYQQLGGLHGALTGGADELLDELDDEGRDLAEQLMIRMVQKGRSMNTSRPVALRDLLELGADSVALRAVLEAFSSRRLITFDRDASGAAVVEIAHEYLLSAWPHLVKWIEKHSIDLDRLYALDSAAEEYLKAERSTDYLMRGERLDRFAVWRSETTIRLTKTETEFIEASIELREREEATDREQKAKEASLAKRARRRLWAFGIAVAAFAAAATTLVITLLPEPPPDVIVVACCPGDGSFGDMIFSGVDKALEGTQLTTLHLSDVWDPNALAKVEEALSAGTGLIVVDPGTVQPLLVSDAFNRYPESIFYIPDCQPDFDDIWDNVACAWTNQNEVGFLAGVAAALVSETGLVGFIGGVDLPVIHEFEAGFNQGVHLIDSNIMVDAIYLTGWDGVELDQGGFSSKGLGDLAAQRLMAAGADVIFPAAGYSGYGVFRAVGRKADLGEVVWAIGVDVDQYLQYQAWDERYIDGAARDMDLTRILTSVLKRIDFGAEQAVTEYLQTGRMSDVRLTLANGGVGYTLTGGRLDPYVVELERVIELVRSAEITISTERDTETVLLRELPDS